MIKIRHSDIHSYPTVFFIKIRKFGGRSLLSKESEKFFSDENFASTLIEYDESRHDIVKILGASKFQKALKLKSKSSNKKLTLIDLEVRNDLGKSDMIFTFERGGISQITLDALKFTFQNHLLLNIKFVCKSTLKSIIPMKSREEFNFLKLTLSKSFASKSSKLSDNYKFSFSKKYVDSQIPFLMFTPCLSGTAELAKGPKTKKRKK